MPAPFAWIDIPQSKRRNRPAAPYKIAKYPITNAQFKLFVDAGGYEESKWWTEAGWKVREEGWHYDSGWKPSGEPWTKPRFWNDAKWNGTEQPVVGVSWYEAVAFCLWLSDVSGEQIMLPTERQWRYAAQGDDGRDYPWGKDWDCNRCNNWVSPCNSSATTPVQHYEGQGDSLFGVVDMAGNVLELCLTDHATGTSDLNNEANYRVVRGGSWNFTGSEYFRCDHRFRYFPRGWGNYVGFRPSRS